ncbi:MAG: type II toxin-antitoxin system VapC family toxin [Myxococcaceae bacterium]|nr:type II toxin-antitoxin system VapC family toxin [Myxococcaceae bacterium]
MARRFLLDTNVVSTLAVDPHGALAARCLAAGEDRLCTSIIVACELRFGALKKGSPRLTEQLDAVLASLRVLPFEHGADEEYAHIRHELDRRGKLIGQNDLLIAAHALALGCVVVTDNEREFRRVSGLEVENWLKRR